VKNKLFTKQTKFFIVVIAITIVFFCPAIFKIDGGVALALDTGLDKTATAAQLPTNTSIAGIIGQIIYAILGFLGVIFIILLIYGGFIRMTAQGAPDKIKTSTGIITSAIVDIIIILASYAITAFVMGGIKDSIGSGSDNTANCGSLNGTCVTAGTCTQSDIGQLNCAQGSICCMATIPSP